MQKEQLRKRFKDVVFYGDCIVNDGVVIGDGTLIGEYTYIGKDSIIGHDCRILYHVTISKDALIGNHVFIGPNTSLLNDKYPPSIKSEPVTIDDGVVIGGGCTILPGVHLMKNCMIGAGSVVTRNVFPDNIFMGNPARFYKMRGKI